MKAANLVLLFALVIANAPLLQAANPIKLVRQPLSNGEAIKLNMDAQEQMMKGDLAGAAETIERAMQKDSRLWLTYFSRARLFELEGKYKLVIEDCNVVLRKYPKFIEAALLQGCG